MRILIVENDLILKRLIKERLSSVYVFNFVDNLAQAQQLLESFSFQALILDISTVAEDVFSFLKLLRRDKKSLAVLLISTRQQGSKELKKYYRLVDSFLQKPFTLEELEISVFGLFNHLKVKNPEESLMFKDLNTKQKSLLSKKEFLLLSALLKNKGRILKKENLAQQVWNSEEAVTNNTLEAHISSLRKKLKKPQIKTVRGLGYCVEEDFK